MPKRKRPVEPPDEQFRRFAEMAKDKDVDEREAERKFKRLAPKPDKKSSAQ